MTDEEFGENLDKYAGEIFGQKRPPLHLTIAKILKEYPVGQIFKEIIQNADDARATTVKFYLDERNIQTLPKKLVPWNQTEDFYGPALMTYNNAPFKQEDWESIQTIHDSRKASNLHKVGKFGIGFNSVYHLTDLPVIVSQDFCGFLEPYEEIWKGESGRGFKLRYLSHKCPEVLAPYHNIEGFSKHEASFVDKTIMRFPFRKKGDKKISEPFDIKKLQELMEVLKSEAKYLLLFLRSVCSIEVIRLSPAGKNTIFKVEINTEQHKELKQSLVQQVETKFTHDKFSNEIVEEVSHFFVNVVDGSQTSTHNWIVVHRVGSENNEVLQLARRQHVLPWVGTACEISSNLNDPSHPMGRIFCFLPLPTEERTPFKIHVNGTFAMSSNRKSLNWESQERYNDEDAIWNRYLVQHCIPKCYTRLISELIEAQVSSDIVYASWPLPSNVKQTPWKGMLTPVFENICTSDEAVYSCHDQWISIKDGIFLPPDTFSKGISLISSFIANIFENAGKHLVKLPVECLSAVSASMKQLTPNILRKILKSNQYCYHQLSHMQKLSLLEYCLSDEDYTDLVGISLVPLVDNSFGNFQPQYCKEYYVCNTKIRFDLFQEVNVPVIDLLDTKPSLHHSLINVAKSHQTQLKVLNVERVVNLLNQLYPQRWSVSQIEKLWEWLQNYDLTKFEGLQIVPVKKLTFHQKLTKCTGLVYVSQYHYPNEYLLSALEKFRINFACHSDFSFLNHHHLNRLLNQFEIDDIIDAISAHGIGEVSVTNNEADAILEFVSSSTVKTLSTQRTVKIIQMKLFSILNSSKRKSINESKIGGKALVQGNGFVFRKDLIPKNGKNVLIDKYNVACLFTRHARVINGSEYLQEVVFPLIKSNYFPKHILPDFMISILQNFDFLSNQFPSQAFSFSQYLSSLSFVSVETGGLEPPSSLFDPKDKVLKKLYTGEPKFPTGIYMEYLDVLRRCGLKGSESLTAQDLLTIVVNVGQQLNFSLNTEYNYLKLQGIFSFLESNPYFLSQSVIYTAQKKESLLKNAIAQCAKIYPLLIIESNRPKKYPKSLKWKVDEYHQSVVKFNAQNTVPLMDDTSDINYPSPLIIGSQALFINNLPTEIAKILFGSNNELLNAVVHHFQHVIDLRKSIKSDTLEDIAMQTYEFLQSCDYYMYDLSILDECVWIDSHSNFVKPKMCAFGHNDTLEVNLEPFTYVLSFKMHKYRSFLEHLGVKENISDNQIISILQSLGQHGNIKDTKAWSLVRCIIDWAIETGNISSDFPIPVLKEHSTFPQLYPLKEVFYADFGILLEISESEGYKLIHPDFAHLADKLQLPLLSDELKITEDVFQDAGQQETLITRLNNILDEYKDGLTIIKELVQNADDAGATEVNILYDDRQHDTKKLFFKGMADCHGPALIIQNNAQFSEEDFTNITKLAGATKKNDSLKIGKFGVGFCSVYHITDVPSFVSGEWLYIFDPTLAHLKGVVKNENQPGKRVKYMSDFIGKSNQLVPYNNLFNFNPSKKYNGTMFRLPFRTNPSLISKTRYNKKHVQQLLQELINKSGNMLLFLNNIKKITFSCMNSEGSLKAEMVAIKTKNPHGIIDIHVSHRGSEQNKTEHWLVASHEDRLHGDTYASSVACQLTEMNGNPQYELVSTIDGNLFCFLPLSVPSIGLPVHIHANFAVMNNRNGIWIEDEWNEHLVHEVIPEAYFKLLIKLKDMNCNKLLEQYPFYDPWPLLSTLKTQIPWMNLLKPVYQLILDNSLFYSDVVQDWKCLQDGKVFHCTFQVDENSFFIEAARVLHLPILLLPDTYMEQIHSFDFNIPILTLVDLLNLLFENIQLFENHTNIRDAVLLHAFEELSNLIEEREITEGSFELEELLITTEGQQCMTDIAENSSEDKTNLDTLLSILRSNECVPCETHNGGSILRYCTDVVDPTSNISKLFVDEKSRFPVSIFTLNKKVHGILIHLGMLRSTMPWTLLLNRAQIISCKYKNDKNSKELVNILIECIKNNISSKNYPCQYSTNKIEVLKNTKFLPVLQKPKSYPIKWHGDKTELCAPSQILHTSWGSEKSMFLVGSQYYIFNNDNNNGCKSIPLSVVKLLEIKNSVTIDSVLAHYQMVIQSAGEIKSGEFVEKTSKFVYKYFETTLLKEISESEKTPSLAADNTASSITVKEKLSSMNGVPFVWTGRAFIRPSDIALNWTKEGPFLFKIPPILSQHKHLVEALGIEEYFSAKKVVETFKQMASQFTNKILPKPCYPIVVEMLSCLNKMKDEDLENIEDVILPNNNYQFYFVQDLAYNDTPWIKSEKDINFVHKGLLRTAATKLGVESNRTKYISSFESRQEKICDKSSQEFGQKEKLTQRIKNILRSYQLDNTFMKEFLQNADDAQATKLFVILDKRNHKTKYTPSKKWSKLQGPALMVWNNKDFSDKDLEGIQSLGSGSKQNDPDSIGEFGIGFNVVYHITDCPSLLTRKNVFCVFDPCCQYLPNSSEENPGRRFNTHQEFWSNFKDLCDPLLISKPIPGQPDCLREGSLFRFPLRCEEENNSIAEAITVESMEKHLNNWLTDVKESLLFLNHITCFKLLVIDENGFQTKVSYNISAERKSCRLKTEPMVVCYPLSIRSVDNVRGVCSNEHWLIQQGIGDVMQDCSQAKDTGDHLGDHLEVSELLETPDESHQLLTHAIAAPLTASDTPLKGKVFCFLPLPGCSGLPVHINGRFVLNDSRRGLWNGSSNDVKTKWNKALMTALSSSYAKLIENIRQHLITRNDTDMKSLLDKFYSLFPYWLKETSAEHVYEEVQMMNECKEMAKCFFEKISVLNNNILASEGCEQSFNIEWNPIIVGHVDEGGQELLSYDQVYFSDKPDVFCKDILKMIGMKLTCAPDRLRMHLQERDRDRLVVNEDSVSKFYALFHTKIVLTEKIPCHISKTPFEKVVNFTKFLKLVTRNKEKTKFREFVQCPDELPVIITADKKLRRFIRSETISSNHYDLFPKSSCLFLHKSLMKLDLDESYFITKADHCLIQTLMENNFPNLSQNIVKGQVISKESLQNLWECFDRENIFEGSHSYVLHNWAMLPCTNNYLYKSSSMIKPVQGQGNSLMTELLTKLSVPILDQSFECIITLDSSFCPRISSDCDEVLTILYEVYQHEKYIFGQLSYFELKQLLQYLSRCSFRHNSIILQQILSFPLFHTIDGRRISLQDRTVFLWPEKLSEVGYSIWKEDNVVFLKHEGLWTNLSGTDSAVLCSEIDILDVYNNYIFKYFLKMTKNHQKMHLRCIKDSIYKDALHQRESSQNESAILFLSTLSKVKCIEDSSGECLAIKDLCDPHSKLFNTFKHVESIKVFPDEFLKKDWIEFFKALGIRENVTKEEYLQLCEEVSRHHDMQTASNVLVKYLFSKYPVENDWYEDDTFIEKLKTIKFVVADEMKRHSWITPPIWKCSEGPDSPPRLMSFNEKLASYDDCADLVWTVMPCLKLPKIDINHEKKQKDLIQKLGITCTPMVEEIYQNIINLSKTTFANFELFFQYSAPVCDENNQDLFEVMIRNIEKLSQLDDETCTYLKKLQSVSCIPVCASSTVRKPVLVNSYQVVVSKSCNLDDRLSPYIQFISGSVHRINDPLLKMGMNSVISLKNIQYLLKVAYDQFKEVQCIAPNEQLLLNACIEKLHMLLLDANSSGDELTDLKPLYLPSSDGSMKPALLLLYLNCARYKRHITPIINQLKGSACSLFKIPSNGEGICEVDEEKICLQLTSDLRPTGFSLVCYEVPFLPEICADDEVDGGLYSHFNNLQKLLFEDHNTLEQNFINLLSLRFPDRLDDIKDFTKNVFKLIKSIHLVKVNDLRIKIMIEDDVICCVKEDFCFKRSESKLYMYIDNNTMYSPYSSVWKDASHLLCLEVALSIFKTRESVFLSFSESLSSFLQIVSLNDMKSILQNEPSWNNKFEGIIKIEIGTDITQTWKDEFNFIKRSDNVFRLQEYVGFEINGKLVWSIVLEVSDEQCIIIDLSDDQSMTVRTNEIFKVCPKRKPGESQNQSMLAILQQPEQCLEEAHRWLRQAECDYNAMEILFDAAEENKHAHDVTSPALFMAFSVLEKGLKSAMYALDGLSDYLLHKHYICQLASLIYHLTKHECDLTSTANEMSNYYLKTRYPNLHTLPKTPSSCFSFSQSLRDRTIHQTQEVLKKVRQIIAEAEFKKEEGSSITSLEDSNENNDSDDSEHSN